MTANNPAIAPLGEAKPNTEAFRLLAKRMGFTEACFDDRDDDMARQAFNAREPRAAGIEWNMLKAKGWSASPSRDAMRRSPKATFPRRRGSASSDSAKSLLAEGKPPPTHLRLPLKSGGEKPDAWRTLSAGVHFTAGAQLPQLIVC